MKQGKVYLRVLALAFLGAVLAYILIAVGSAVTDPLSTTLAISYEASEYAQVEGVIIRDEQLLTADYPIIQPALADGEKAAAGQTLALGYQSATDAQSQAELDQVTRRLEQLQTLYRTQLTASEAIRLDSQIGQLVVDLNVSAAEGNWAGAAENSWNVQTAVLQRSAGDLDLEDVERQIEELAARQQSLNRSGSAGAALRAQSSGWFCSGSDGYEGRYSLTTALDLTTADLDDARNQALNIPSVYGRLITDETWYFACNMDHDQARQAQRLGSVRVDFSGGAGLSANMSVVQVGVADDDNRCVVVFGCDRYISQVANLRFVEAGVAFSTWSGLRVPKNAIHLVPVEPDETEDPAEDAESAEDDEDAEAAAQTVAAAVPDYRTGVYVIEGGRAVFKEVEILLDTGSAYVVREDPSSTNNLWAGDEIIVSARDLFDGKVVR